MHFLTQHTSNRIILLCVLSTVLTGFSYGQPRDRILTTQDDCETKRENPPVPPKGFLLGRPLTQAVDSVTCVLAERTDPKERALLLERIAHLHVLMGDYALALEHALTALKLGETLEDPVIICKAYKQIGSIYHYQHNYTAAEIYFQKQLGTARWLRDSASISSGFLNLAHIYRLTGRTQQAWHAYTNSMVIHPAKKRSYFEHKVYADLGKLFASCGMWEEALQCHSIHFEWIRRTRPYHTLALSNAYINLANVYTQTGALQKGIEVASLGAELAEQYGYQEHLKEHYRHLSEAWHQQGQPEKAYAYRIRYDQIKDQLLNAENQGQIAALEAAYQRKKLENEARLKAQENEIHLLKLERKEQLIYTLSAGALALAIISLLLVRQRQQRLHRKTLELKEKLLRKQMDPHFIFNSLIAIQGFILENNPDDASDYLTRYAELNRMILHNSQKELITLEEELQALKHYMVLQNLRFGSSIDCRVTVADDVDPEETYLPPMLLQPFVENAFQHGLSELPQGGELMLNIYLLEGHVCLEVIDNGPGIRASLPASRSARHLSIATRITRERLQLIGQKTGYQIDLCIEDRSDHREKGTRVTLRIPFACAFGNDHHQPSVA